MSNWNNLVSNMDGAVQSNLGGPVLYTPAAGNGDPVTIQGVFDRQYIAVDAGQAGVASAIPALFVRLADLPTDPMQDDPTITIDGVAYRVVEPKLDGQGGALLHLHKKSKNA